jgi:hypothetical protein
MRKISMFAAALVTDWYLSVGHYDQPAGCRVNTGRNRYAADDGERDERIR